MTSLKEKSVVSERKVVKRLGRHLAIHLACPVGLLCTHHLFSTPIPTSPNSSHPGSDSCRLSAGAASSTLVRRTWCVPTRWWLVNVKLNPVGSTSSASERVCEAHWALSCTSDSGSGESLASTLPKLRNRAKFVKMRVDRDRPTSRAPDC